MTDRTARMRELERRGFKLGTIAYWHPRGTIVPLRRLATMTDEEFATLLNNRRLTDGRNSDSDQEGM